MFLLLFNQDDVVLVILALLLFFPVLMFTEADDFTNRSAYTTDVRGIDTGDRLSDSVGREIVDRFRDSDISWLKTRL